MPKTTTVDTTATADATTDSTDAAKRAKAPARSVQQRAREALDTAQRKVDRAVKRRTEAQFTLSTIDSEIGHLEAERDYLAAHPALRTVVAEGVSADPIEAAAAEAEAVTQA